MQNWRLVLVVCAVGAHLSAVACGADDNVIKVRDEGEGGAGAGGEGPSVAGSQSVAGVQSFGGDPAAMGGVGGIGDVGGVGGEVTTQAGAAGVGGAGGAAAVDAVPPTITLVASSVRVTSASDVTLTATASDDVGVVDVVFYEEDTKLGTDASAAYEHVVSFTAADNGIHRYRAVARDAEGNTTEALVTVVVGIDATAPLWQIQMNGVRGVSGVHSILARGLGIDGLGQPVTVLSSAQGDEAAVRYDLKAAPTLLYGTGTQNPNTYLHAAAGVGDDQVAVVGSTDGCGCSSIVHNQLLIGGALGLVSHHNDMPTSGESEQGYAVAANSNGDIYVAGLTRGSLPEQGASPRTNPTAGTKFDAFLLKWSAGDVAWVRQWGTDDDDIATDVVVDAGGRVWVAGTSAGGLGLNGQTPLGGTDGWVVAFDADGALLSTRQFGSTGDDSVAGIAALPAGGVVIAGYGVLPPAGVTATAGDTLGGVDGWLRFYDATFNATKTLSLGTAAEDTLGGVAADASGEVWVCGTTAGTLGAAPFGGKDAFVRAYVDDAPLFTRQIGTASDESAVGCAVDEDGSVFVLGNTGGDLFAPREGAADAFLVGLGLLGNYR